MSHTKVYTEQRKKDFDRKGSWEGYNKQIAHGFHWLSPCQERREILIPPCWALLDNRV